MWNDFYWGTILELLVNPNVSEDIISKLSLICANRLNGYQIKKKAGIATFGYLMKAFSLSDYLVRGITMHRHKLLFPVLLDKITQPEVVSQKNLFYGIDETGARVYMDVRFPGDSETVNFALSKWWENEKAHIDLYSQVLDILTRNIEIYYGYIKSIGSDAFYDMISCDVDNFISGNMPEYGNYCVIKIIREILIKSEESVRKQFLSKYADCKDSILVRLKLLAVEKSEELTANEKIIWLIENELLLQVRKNVFADFEVYEILRSNLQAVSEQTKNRLLRYIEAPGDDNNSETIDSSWLRYELCCWIKGVAKSWQKDINPLISKYKTKSYLTEKMSPLSRQARFSDVSEVAPAKDKNEFLQELEDNPSKAMSDLLNKRLPNEHLVAFEGLETGSSRYQTISETISQDPSLSIKLWDESQNLANINYEPRDVRLTILEVLREIMDYSQAEKMIEKVQCMIQEDEPSDNDLHALFLYLRHCSKGKEYSDVDHALNKITEICESIWDMNQERVTYTHDNENPSRMSFSYWPFLLSETLIAVIQNLNSCDKYMTVRMRVVALIQIIMQGESDASKVAAFRLCVSFYTIFYYDEDFGNNTLIPYFNEAPVKGTARWFAWAALILYQNFDISILNSGLLETIMHTKKEISDQLTDTELLRCYQKLLFRILSYCDLDDKTKLELQIFISRDEILSSGVMSHVYRISVSEKMVDIWERWLKDYVKNRLLNRPIKLTWREFSTIINIALEPSMVMKDITDAIIESKQVIDFAANASDDLRFSHDILDKMSEAQLESLIELICYILGHHTGDIGYWFRRSVFEICKEVNPSYQKQLLEACEEAGVSLIVV